MTATAHPLEGVRVLDLSRLLPGPYCTLILAQLGAEVIKVEDTGAGDYLRALPPQRGGMGGAFYALNRGKRSIALDLKTDEGRELLLSLVAETRVLVESFRPGVLDRLGLTRELLQRARPDLIICRITGYGQDGPWAARAGHDINYMALAGALALGGERDGPPVTPGVQVADIAGGALWATIRILAALRSEQGADLDVSMTEGAMSLLLPAWGDFAFGGDPPRRGRDTLDGGNAAYGSYRTADERHLAVGALEPKFGAALGELLQLEGCDRALVADEQEQRQLRTQLSGALEKRSRQAWETELARVDACVEPVLEMEELPDHPQHAARRAFFSADDQERLSPRLMQLPLDGAPPTCPAPCQGEDTRALLQELGFDDTAIAELIQRGIVRAPRR